MRRASLILLVALVGCKHESPPCTSTIDGCFSIPFRPADAYSFHGQFLLIEKGGSETVAPK